MLVYSICDDRRPEITMSTEVITSIEGRIGPRSTAR